MEYFNHSHCKYTNIKGFVRLYEYALKWSYMISDKAKHRAKVLAFWEKYGLKATQEAFNVGRSTLFLWKKRFYENGSKIEALNDESRAPKTKRKRLWPEKLINQIESIKQEHPNLGKNKIHIFLEPWCLEHDLKCPSITTIGRLIKDKGGMRTFPQKVSHFGKIKQLKRKKKLRKHKGFKADHPGHLGAFDTIEKFVSGCRRYVITFVDIYSRFTFAWSTTSHASKAAQEVFGYIKQVFPYPLEHILTDNGSEFMKDFEKALSTEHVVHWHTYPKSPKMNTHNERFNRTIQEKFIDYHVPTLIEPKKFNIKLMDYLIWYNTQRPHWSLGLKSPVQFLLTNHPESKDRWTNTKICLVLKKRLLLINSVPLSHRANTKQAPSRNRKRSDGYEL